MVIKNWFKESVCAFNPLYLTVRPELLLLFLQILIHGNNGTKLLKNAEKKKTTTHEQVLGKSKMLFTR